MDLIEIQVGDETWKIRKLPQYQITKLIGSGAKDLADILVDMVLASVVEPKQLRREDVIRILNDDKAYFTLVTQLENINEKGIRALGNYMLSSIRSSPRSETSSNST